MNEVSFASLVNTLLSELGAKNGNSRSCFVFTRKTKENDGGIDAQCIGATQIVTNLIPKLNTDYQYKSGREEKSAAIIVRDDILKKPRVINGLKDGHAFVYVTANDRSTSMSKSIWQKLVETKPAISEEQIVFVGAEDIAKQLLCFPAIIARILKIDVPLFDFEKWSQLEAFDNH